MHLHLRRLLGTAQWARRGADVSWDQHPNRQPLPPRKFPRSLQGTVWVHDEKGYVGEIEKLTVYLAMWKPGRRRLAAR
jgi:hypothetical protein